MYGKKKLGWTIIGLFFWVELFAGHFSYALAAWVATDDFESYSNGQNVNGLNGGTGWSTAWSDTASTDWKISNTNVPEGTLTAKDTGLHTAASQQLSRTFSDTTTGIMHFKAAWGGSIANDRILEFMTGSTKRWVLYMLGGGDLELFDGSFGTQTTVKTGMSAGTAYDIYFSYDTGANTAKARVGSDNWSSTITGNSTGALNGIQSENYDQTTYIVLDNICPASDYPTSGCTGGGGGGPPPAEGTTTPLITNDTNYYVTIILMIIATLLGLDLLRRMMAKYQIG